MSKLRFELSFEDAATIASFIPDIIEKGLRESDAPAFIRLAEELSKSIKPAFPAGFKSLEAYQAWLADE